MLKVKIDTDRENKLKHLMVSLVTISIAYLIVFVIVNAIHFNVFVVSVILYACLTDILITNAIVALFYFRIIRPHTDIYDTEALLVALVSNLALLFYSVMGPTVIDRSLSLYIVNKIDQRGGQISEASVGDIFVLEYLPEFRLVDVRMTEQVTSGTVHIDNGCVYLTDRGKFISSFVSFYRSHFLPKKRNLMGEVTDQLTDPFRNAEQIVDTKCDADETE